jgi:hypothetical protein
MKKIILVTVSILLMFTTFASYQNNQTTRIKFGKRIEVSIDDMNKKILSINFITDKSEQSIDTLVVGNDTIVTVKRFQTIRPYEDKDLPLIVNGDTLMSENQLRNFEVTIEENLDSLAQNLDSMTYTYTYELVFDSLIYDIDNILNSKELEEFSKLDEDFDLKIVIPELPKTDGLTDAQLEDDEDDESEETKSKKKSKFNGHWEGFEFGFIGMTQDQNFINDSHPYSNRPFRSWNFGINLIQIDIPLISNNLGVVTGLGMGWKNIHFANNYKMTTDASGVNFEALSNPDSKLTRNRLSSFYLSMPLALELQFKTLNGKSKFFVMAGGYGHLKLDSDYRTKIETNGVVESNSSDGDFFLSDLEYGLTARVGFDELNLFANYSLSGLFRENRGPEIHPLTFGVMVIPFY